MEAEIERLRVMPSVLPTSARASGEEIEIGSGLPPTRKFTDRATTACIGSYAVKAIEKCPSGWGARSTPIETPPRRRSRYSRQEITAVSSLGSVRRSYITIVQPLWRWCDPSAIALSWFPLCGRWNIQMCAVRIRGCQVRVAWVASDFRTFGNSAAQLRLAPDMEEQLGGACCAPNRR
jgi:hypothetical protein